MTFVTVGGCPPGHPPPSGGSRQEAFLARGTSTILTGVELCASGLLHTTSIARTRVSRVCPHFGQLQKKVDLFVVAIRFNDTGKLAWPQPGTGGRHTRQTWIWGSRDGLDSRTTRASGEGPFWSESSVKRRSRASADETLRTRTGAVRQSRRASGSACYEKRNRSTLPARRLARSSCAPAFFPDKQKPAPRRKHSPVPLAEATPRRSGRTSSVILGVGCSRSLSRA